MDDEANPGSRDETMHVALRREVMGAWRPAEMTVETAPGWLSQMTPTDYVARRNVENREAARDVEYHKDWLTAAASMLHSDGARSPSEFGSYGHSRLIASEALIATRDALLDIILGQRSEIAALLNKVERMRSAPPPPDGSPSD